MTISRELSNIRKEIEEASKNKPDIEVKEIETAPYNQELLDDIREKRRIAETKRKMRVGKFKRHSTFSDNFKKKYRG